MKIWLVILICCVVGVPIFAESFKDDYESVWGPLNQIEYKGFTVYYKDEVLEKSEFSLVHSNEYDYVELGIFKVSGKKFSVSWVKGNGPLGRGIGRLAVRDSSNGDLNLYGANAICVPNTSSIYTKKIESIGTLSDKYTFQNLKYVVISQPFYYLGTLMAINVPVDIYENDRLEKKSATLVAGSNILIVGIAFSNYASDPILIVKSSTGLLGFVKPRITNNPKKEGDMVEYDFPMFNHLLSFAG